MEKLSEFDAMQTELSAAAVSNANSTLQAKHEAATQAQAQAAAAAIAPRHASPKVPVGVEYS